MAYPFRWPSGAQRCGEEAAADAIISRSRRRSGRTRSRAWSSSRSRARAASSYPPEGFLPRLAEYCRANGIVFVADEMQTGFARTGDWFACDHEGVVPDLITTAKGIAGGLPLAGVTGRAEIMDAVHVGGLGGTYGGNPVACAAALGAIATIEEEDLVARPAGSVSSWSAPAAARWPSSSRVIGDVRGRGAMMAVELVHPGTTEPPNAALTAAIAKACHEQGVVVLTCGTFGNVLRLLPPLVIPDASARRGPDRAREGLRRPLIPPRRLPVSVAVTGGAC